MVVPAKSIARQMQLPFYYILRTGAVAEGHTHNAATAGLQQPRVGALVAVALQITHCTVKYEGDPKVKMGCPL